MRFEGVPGENEDDALIYTVTDVTPDAVVVDGNHPLAGERLWFKGTVQAVRRATPEELEHEHVHDDPESRDIGTSGPGPRLEAEEPRVVRGRPSPSPSPTNGLP